MIPWDEMLDDEFKLSMNEGPFYSDYLINVQKTYPNAGLGKCPWANDTPRLYEIKDILIEHFDFIYKYREIGAETEERWQYTVDRVFDNIKRKYEFALMQYKENDIEIIGKYFKETTTRTSKGEIVGSSSREGTTSTTVTDTSKSSFNDTPIQRLIDTGNYASSISDDLVESESSGTNNVESGDTKNIDITDEVVREHTESPNSIIDSVNDTIDKFRDLIDDFVDEFHVCFISTLGRI